MDKKIIKVNIEDFDPSKQYPKGSVVVVVVDFDFIDSKIEIPDFLKGDSLKKEEDG